MIFIDGGYLKRNLKNFFGTEYIDFHLFVNSLNQVLKGKILPQFSFELIRTYYYDAVLRDEQTPDFYIDELSIIQGIEIRLGDVVKGNSGNRQKGVDSLIALDMLTKSYGNQYDIAIIVAGDRDFLEIVRTVKNSGKRVFGAFFNETISEELKASFDSYFVLTKQWLEDYILNPVSSEMEFKEKFKNMLISSQKEILIGLHKYDPFSRYQSEKFLDLILSSHAKANILLHGDGSYRDIINMTKSLPRVEIRTQNSSLPLKYNMLIVDQSQYLKIKLDAKNYVFGISSEEKSPVKRQISKFEEEWAQAEVSK